MGIRAKNIIPRGTRLQCIKSLYQDGDIEILTQGKTYKVLSSSQSVVVVTANKGIKGIFYAQAHGLFRFKKLVNWDKLIETHPYRKRYPSIIAGFIK